MRASMCLLFFNSPEQILLHKRKINPGLFNFVDIFHASSVINSFLTP